MGLGDWLNRLAEHEQKVGEEIAQQPEYSNRGEMYRNEEPEETSPEDRFKKEAGEQGRAEFQQIKNALESANAEIESNISKLKDIEKQLIDDVQDYKEYVERYPNNLAVKEEIKRVVIITGSKIMALSTYKNNQLEVFKPKFQNLWPAGSDKLITELQSKYKTNLEVLESEENYQKRFVYLDRLANFYFGKTDQPPYQLARRKDGSLFPFSSPSIKQILSEETEKSQKEEFLELQKNNLIDQEKFNDRIAKALEDIADKLDDIGSERGGSNGIGLKEIAIGGFTFNAFKNFMYDRDRRFADLLGRELKR